MVLWAISGHYKCYYVIIIIIIIIIIILFVWKERLAL